MSRKRIETHETPIEDCLLLEPEVRADVRGWFVRVYDDDLSPKAPGTPDGCWRQEYQVRSRRGTVRGFHYRQDLAEAKLVRVIAGEVLDVVFDMRPWSTTFGRRAEFILSEHNHHQVYVPPGCAHAVQALADRTDMVTKTSSAHSPELDGGFAYDDPDVGVRWPLPPVLSDRDADGPSFASIKESLTEWYGTEPPIAPRV